MLKTNQINYSNDRMNQDYRIIDAINVGESEFVLAQNTKALDSFVTWQCKNGNDYFWGHYIDNLLDAKLDFAERITSEAQVQKELQVVTNKKEKTVDEKFEKLLKDSGYTQISNDTLEKLGIISIEKNGKETRLDGKREANEFLIKESSTMQQAEQLINEAEKTQTLLGNGERNLIMNCAYHSRNIDIVKILTDKLCISGYEKEHGYVNPELETFINEKIQNENIYKYQIVTDETKKYIELKGNDYGRCFERTLIFPRTPGETIDYADVEKFKKYFLDCMKDSMSNDDNMFGFIDFTDQKAYSKAIDEQYAEIMDEPVNQKIIGEIDYLSTSGKVGYTTKYSDITAFEKDITECLNDGVPIEVRDFSKQNIYSNAVEDMCGYDETEEIEKEKWEQEQREKAIAEQEKMFSQENVTSDEQSEFEEDDEMEM